MEVSLTAQFAALLAAFVFGIGLGILYDGYRVFLVLLGLLGGGERRPLPSSLPLIPPAWLRPRKSRAGKWGRAALLFLLDLLFAAAAGFLFVFFLYAENDGVFRFFLLFGSGVAFFLYLSTVGRIVFRAAARLAFYLHILLLYGAHFLTLPIRFFLHLLALLAKKLLLPLVRRLFLPLWRRLSFRLLFRRTAHTLAGTLAAIERA